MTALFTIIVLVSITIAIWQMVKIFDLASAKKEDSEIANDRDNRINGNLMLGFLGFIYAITIVCIVLYGDLPLLSNSASESVLFPNFNKILSEFRRSIPFNFSLSS